MGQRHQIYVVNKKENKYKPLGAFHHQWCYGLTATCNLTRACQLIEINKVRAIRPWNDYALSDKREIETLIKATYGVDCHGNTSMLHNEEKYLMDDNSIYPSRGDNNDGCSLIVIDDDAKEVRGCMFTAHHLEGEFSRSVEQYKAYTREEYIAFYYKTEKIKDTKELEIIAKYNLKPVHDYEMALLMAKDKESKN